MRMSLDGYIAAPDDNPEQGLGEDGMRPHNWAFEDPSAFERVYGNLVEETGAVIMGRRSYDNSIETWGGKGPLGGVPLARATGRGMPAGSGPAMPLPALRSRRTGSWPRHDQRLASPPTPATTFGSAEPADTPRRPGRWRLALPERPGDGNIPWLVSARGRSYGR
jgi:hypothetical protein